MHAFALVWGVGGGLWLYKHWKRVCTESDCLLFMTDDCIGYFCCFFFHLLPNTNTLTLAAKCVSALLLFCVLPERINWCRRRLAWWIPRGEGQAGRHELGRDCGGGGGSHPRPWRAHAWEAVLPLQEEVTHRVTAPARSQAGQGPGAAREAAAGESGEAPRVVQKGRCCSTAIGWWWLWWFSVGC